MGRTHRQEITPEQVARMVLVRQVADKIWDACDHSWTNDPNRIRLCVRETRDGTGRLVDLDLGFAEVMWWVTDDLQVVEEEPECPEGFAWAEHPVYLVNGPTEFAASELVRRLGYDRPAAELAKIRAQIAARAAATVDIPF